MVKKLLKLFKGESLRRDTTLAERRVRMEKITGNKGTTWGKGPEFQQNKVLSPPV